MDLPRFNPEDIKVRQLPDAQSIRDDLFWKAYLQWLQKQNKTIDRRFLEEAADAVTEKHPR